MQAVPLSSLAVSGYLVSPPQLISDDRFARGMEGRSTLGKLAKFAENVARGRAALAEQGKRFDALYRETAETLNRPDEVEQLAEAVLANERRVARNFLPRVEELRRRLSEPRAKVDTPEMRAWRRSAEEMIEMSVTWLELYQQVRIRLLKLASDRRSETEPPSPVFSDSASAIEYLRKLVAE
jgi:hypothetical protein